eukprot:TRINITY_DN5580_c5_g2_i3.p1 TRINITY_DN5580_c5_g2~~TRINITY_DN5580_c5_g2_i3.p1  ORF type:complete len:577 (+),score=175.88 TRINITY_DN5580_c5_g2_i3:69-1799(+)
MPANPSGPPLHPPTSSPHRAGHPMAYTPSYAPPASTPRHPAGYASTPPAEHASTQIVQLNHMAQEVGSISARIHAAQEMELDKLRLEEQVTGLQRDLLELSRQLGQEESARRAEADASAVLREELTHRAEEAEAENAKLRELHQTFEDEKAVMNAHFARVGEELRRTDAECARLQRENVELRQEAERRVRTEAEFERLLREVAERRARSAADAAVLVGVVPALHDAARRGQAAATALQAGDPECINVLGAPPPFPAPQQVGADQAEPGAHAAGELRSAAEAACAAVGRLQSVARERLGDDAAVLRRQLDEERRAHAQVSAAHAEQVRTLREQLEHWQVEAGKLRAYADVVQGTNTVERSVPRPASSSPRPHSPLLPVSEPGSPRPAAPVSHVSRQSAMAPVAVPPHGAPSQGPTTPLGQPPHPHQSRAFQQVARIFGPDSDPPQPAGARPPRELPTDSRVILPPPGARGDGRLSPRRGRSGRGSPRKRRQDSPRELRKAQAVAAALHREKGALQIRNETLQREVADLRRNYAALERDAEHMRKELERLGAYARAQHRHVLSVRPRTVMPSDWRPAG